MSNFNLKVVAVIMAGGKGERFWPQSRNDKPKQFLSLTKDSETMIQKTVDRLMPLVDIDDIFVVTNRNYLPMVHQQLPQLPVENIISEPVSRNTAPCISLAAGILRRRYGEDVIMLVLPSDHLIKFNTLYADTLRLAVTKAEQDNNLVTIGIPPTYPETGYGYINFSTESSGDGTYEVIRFVEKPNIELAKEYVNSGEYLWNSGMFIWKVSSILGSMQQLLPDIYEVTEKICGHYGTQQFDDAMSSIFPTLPSESVDFGIMERAKHIYTVPGNFGWDDVGNWLAMERINPTNEYGNMVRGDVISINTRNSIIVGGKKLIATVGIEDIIVVDTEDATLICSKDSAQDVKKVTENLKICNRNELV